ncbi:acid phosphatase [Scenedesmus sp. NREL 46B-D3]|nr:acid phosphatase [Scenedesmus sp. NREL 46B-D3]
MAAAAATSVTLTAASQQQLQQQGEARPLVVFDIDETLLSNMPQILDPEAWPWEQWVAAAQAEPLQPMLALYTALCSHGYSIALVTGRHEASRNSTMANLQRAGYGALCSKHSSSSSAYVPCCYDALLMRPANDTRLASVYKPWARAQLLAGGRYVLAALLGDQFSDINGPGIEAGSEVQAYKLPNPFYFIL